MNKNFKIILFVVGCASFSVSAPSWFSRAKPQTVVAENPFHVGERKNLAAMKETRTQIRAARSAAKRNKWESEDAVEYAMRMHASAPEIHDSAIEQGFKARTRAAAASKRADDLVLLNKQRAVIADKFDEAKKGRRGLSKASARKQSIFSVV